MPYDVNKLVIYRNLMSDDIFREFCEIANAFDQKLYMGEAVEAELKDRVYGWAGRLIAAAIKHGFNEDVWQSYLVYLLISEENPFSLACEKTGDRGGALAKIAKNDLTVIKELFDYDFSAMEKELKLTCFKILADHGLIENGNGKSSGIAQNIGTLTKFIQAAEDAEEFYERLMAFYKGVGVGKLGLNKAFRLRDTETGIDLVPISNISDIQFSDLIGYEAQKEKLIGNTKAFVEGKRANNCLLYGDAGTGKSSSIKAVLNRFYSDGLRMIELQKHQYKLLPEIISSVKGRNYRFIIYMDDLSFEEFETDYKYLKAVIEGGLEVKPENVLIYATSNRRHLIRETWNDRNDMEYNKDIHRSDTMQEKLSLSARFGLTIGYFAPNQDGYLNIVAGIAEEHPELGLPLEELYSEAKKWELNKGGRSGRLARQLVDSLLARETTD